MRKLPFAALAYCLVAGLACGEDLVIAERGKKHCHAIVVGRNGGPSCAYAAEELRDYVAQMTGVELPIAAESAEPSGKVISLNVVGDAELGEDGFELKEKNGNVLVRGGKRGVLYGVYELLETYGGCGWYASWRTVLPKRDTFSVPKGLSDRQMPSFLLREPSWMDVRRHVDFAVRLRMNGAGSNPSARHGVSFCERAASKPYVRQVPACGEVFQ